MNKKTRNSLYTKQYNRKLILRLIQSKRISRAEIARETGLTRASVTLIVEELVKEEIVRECGRGTTYMGRKPALLEINPDAFFSIGLNISREDYTIALVSIGGKVLFKSVTDISINKSASEIISDICVEIEKIKIISKLRNKKIIAMGISTPGPVDVKSGIIINPPNFDKWHNANIAKEFTEKFSFKTILNNHSSSLAVFEKYYGKGKEYNDFILLVVDSGIGSAIVIESKIYRGSVNYGSEIGHASIDINGELCKCGNYGCLELYASIPKIIKQAQYLCGDNIASWNDIVDLAEHGEKSCCEIIEREAKYLSAGIVNAINMLHINTIILTGYITYKNEILKNKLKELVEEKMMSHKNFDINIVFSSAEDVDAIAAAAIAFDEVVFN